MSFVCVGARRLYTLRVAPYSDDTLLAISFTSIHLPPQVLKLRLWRSRLPAVGVLPGIITTRRVSKGCIREDIASDVSLSLTYVSG